MNQPPISKMLNAVEWTAHEPPPDLPAGAIYATHTGQLTIGAVVLDCAVLSDGTRVFTEESILRAFGADGTVESIFQLLTGEALP